MRIDIFSDTICPWCLIGKRRLERALAERPQGDLSIVWHAFQLNPDMPVEGMARQEYLSRKFGGERNAGSIYGRIEAIGAEEGIPFDFAAIQRTPNTLDSHRLIRLATFKGLSEAVVEGLFDAYFMQGRDIGDRSVLLEIAAQAGLEDERVQSLLTGDEFVEDVRTEDNLARRMGIQGVPCFIFNGRHVLSGAQPPEVFWQMFDVVHADTEEAPDHTA